MCVPQKHWGARMSQAITLVEKIQTAEVNNKRKQYVSAPNNELVTNSRWLIWYDLIYKHWLTCQMATCNRPPLAIEWTKFVRGVFLAETDPPCSSPQLETTVLWASAQYVCLWFVYKNLLGNEVTINIAYWKVFYVVWAGIRTGFHARKSNGVPTLLALNPCQSSWGKLLGSRPAQHPKSLFFHICKFHPTYI